MTKKIPVYIKEDIIEYRDTSTYKEVTSIINSKYNTNYVWYTIRDVCCREGKLRQDRKKKAKKEERVCLCCSKHFTSFKRSKSNLKFCSRECYNKYKKENNVDRGKIIKCVYCGKEFTMDLNHKNKRFCSHTFLRAKSFILVV